MSGEQWQQPDFGQIPYNPLTPPEPPHPSDAPPAQKWYKHPGVTISLIVAGLVTGYSLNGPRSGESEPTPPAPFPSSVAPTASVVPTKSETPSQTPTPNKPSASPETISPSGIVFTANGDYGGTISAPAVSWSEGYRNVIRFTCNNSVATAGLTVEDADGEPVKTFKKKAKLDTFLSRPCIGDVVSNDVEEHPGKYYPGMLAVILAKNKL